ncbi:MAG: hypothetical protein FJ405_10465, partial [Verrucomicrobia bacterium]|nr:hypothetical protein [Verrucomicrobiota bacterium]
MKNQNALRCLAVLIALYGIVNSTPSARAQDNLLITEFLANNSTINDDFGQSSDYIELFNGGATAIDLSAYYLTDNLDNLQKWRIPAVNLAPGQHLIIWASGRDLTDPTKPLHANFSLSLNGEALALVRRTNNIVQQFVFGPQVLNRSYGLNSEVISTSTLIGAGTIAQYYTPTNSGNTFTNRWQERDFIVPPNWSSGPLGIGFDTNSSSLFDPLIATDVEGLMNRATRRNTLMVRIPFQITSLGQVPNPYLRMRYDDGFVAYLNGREIARRGFSPTQAPTGTSTSTQNRANDAAIVAEDIFSTALVEGFQEGANVLSFYALRNSAAADGDLLLLPEIKTRQVRYNLADERYFSTPSPGSANSSGIDGAAGPVSFSAASKTYFDPFDVTLIPPTGLANASVHYTLNGTVPTTNSPRYSGPIRLTNSVSIRARAFVPTYLPGPIRTETFMRLDPAMRDISSDLPLVLVHSFGTGGFDDANKRPCVVFVHEPFRGRSSFTNAPDQIFRAGFKIRGSSTAGNPKFNWAVDTWGEDDLDENIPLLGLPSASEWVFHGPFNFDPSLFHNPLASDMSNEIGRYAARYKNIEVYLNQTSPSSASGSATSNIRRSDYFGVYNVLERIGIGPNRVNTPRLTARDLTQPNVTGGYLLSIDRAFGGSSGFSGAGQGINYIDPKFEDMSTAERDPQEQYLTSWFNEFGRTLNPEVRFLNSDVTDAAGFVARLSSRSNGALDYLFRRFSDEGYLFQGEASGSAIVSILNRLQSNVLTGPVSFALADIRSLNPLAARLLAGEGAFDSWVKSQLTAETLSLLAIYNTPAAQPATSNTLRMNIVRDLNVIIAGPSIHNGSRFASVSLRKLTEYFLEKNVAGDD